MALDRLPKFSTITATLSKLFKSSVTRASGSQVDKRSIRLIAGSLTSDSRVLGATEWGVRAGPPTYEDSLVSPSTSGASAPSSSASHST